MKAKQITAIILSALCAACPLIACGVDTSSTADTSSSKSRREQTREEEENEDDDDATTTEATTTSFAETSTTSATETTAPATETTAAATVTTTAPPAQPPVNNVPETGEMLSILCWTDYDLKLMIDFFTAEHPEYSGKVQYTNVGYSGSDAQERYQNYLNGGEDVDLYFTESGWIRDFSDNDYFSRSILDLGFNKMDFANCYDYTLQYGRNTNGDLRGVTWQACPGCYCYRTDLAAQYLGVSSPAEMQEKVKDWDTFTQTAATVYTQSGGKTAMVNSLGGLWQVWQYNRSDAWVNGTSLVTDEFFTDFENLVNTYHKNKYATNIEQWYDEWYDVMQTDSVMGEFLCSWCFGTNGVLSQMEGNPYNSTQLTGATTGKFNICAGPSAWAWGGYFLMLSPHCDNGVIAHDFISDFVVNSDTMLRYAQSRANNDFINNKTVNKQLSGITNPLLGGQSQFAVLDAAADAVTLPPITKYDQFAKDAFNEAFCAYRTSRYSSDLIASYQNKFEAYMNS